MSNDEFDFDKLWNEARRNRLDQKREIDEKKEEEEEKDEVEDVLERYRGMELKQLRQEYCNIVAERRASLQRFFQIQKIGKEVRKIIKEKAKK